jgi:large subunit ribosomal protein L9
VKVILTQDVEGVGEKNDVKDVVGGYVRNFLIPRGMAKLATKGALKELEVTRRTDERKEARQRGEAQRTADKLRTLTLRIPAKTGTSGRLFGSVTTQDIAQRLQEETGIEVDRRKVALEAPIRSIGTYAVSVTIFKGVTSTVSVEVFGGEVVPDEAPAAEAPSAPAEVTAEPTEAPEEDIWADEGGAEAPILVRGRRGRGVADL